jgi:hypothetical protein
LRLKLWSRFQFDVGHLLCIVSVRHGSCCQADSFRLTSDLPNPGMLKWHVCRIPGRKQIPSLLQIKLVSNVVLAMGGLTPNQHSNRYPRPHLLSEPGRVFEYTRFMTVGTFGRRQTGSPASKTQAPEYTVQVSADDRAKIMIQWSRPHLASGFRRVISGARLIWRSRPSQMNPQLRRPLLAERRHCSNSGWRGHTGSPSSASTTAGCNLTEGKSPPPLPGHWNAGELLSSERPRVNRYVCGQ